MLNSSGSQTNKKEFKIGKMIAGIFLGILLLIVVMSSFAIIPAGHTGVRVTLGRVVGHESEGLIFTPPFIQNVVLMDNRTQALEMETEAVTRDLQGVRMVYTVNYSLNSDMAGTVFREIGIGFVSIIIRPTVEETVKDITARYTIEELITQRARVSTDIAAALQANLSIRGFTFERFNIVDFAFSQEFSNAIEQVRIAEQNALRAYQDLERSRHEAEAERVMARAQADVLRYQAAELTDTNLMAMWIERWNGVLPSVMAGDGNGMLLNFSLDDIQASANTPRVPAAPAPTPPPPPPAAQTPAYDADDDND
ncbi:MAG: prohibitin family protein [Oscillospiraceae bacterium]|nr:prohibitin family protein [Oscillospiraceae bacterium]